MARTATAHGTHYRGTPREQLALGAFIKLLRAAHWASLSAGKQREAAGLTESQWGVLEALYHRGPMIQTEIAARLLSSPSNLTLVIDNLERDGLVERRIDALDRRRRVARLTRRGGRLVEHVLPDHVAGIVAVMDSLSEREQRRLAALCRKLGVAAQELVETDDAS